MDGHVKQLRFVDSLALAAETVHTLNIKFGHRLGSREVDIIKAMIDTAIADDVRARDAWLNGEHSIQRACK